MSTHPTSNPFDFFDRVFCINLPGSVSRWDTVSEEFQKVGIRDRVERIWATPPPRGFKMSNYIYPGGEFGACLSHMKALVRGLGCGARAILVFEDDVKFTSNAIGDLRNSIVELPDTWEVFYLGGRPKAPLARISEHLVKVCEFSSAVSYSIKGCAAQRCLELFFDRLGKPFPSACTDNIIAEFAREEGYCAFPRVCTTMPGYSVLRGERRDYTRGINDDWKRYGP